MDGGTENLFEPANSVAEKSREKILAAVWRRGHSAAPTGAFYKGWHGNVKSYFGCSNNV